MNRTPRSASRRARRQLQANEPSPGLAPYRSSVACDSSREIHQLGHARLHPERHLVLGHARVDLGVVRPTRCSAWFERRDRVDHFALLPLGHAGGPVEVLDRRRRSS